MEGEHVLPPALLALSLPPKRVVPVFAKPVYPGFKASPCGELCTDLLSFTLFQLGLREVSRAGV